jgi:hypothetical protein
VVEEVWDVKKLHEIYKMWLAVLGGWWVAWKERWTQGMKNINLNINLQEI